MWKLHLSSVLTNILRFKLSFQKRSAKVGCGIFIVFQKAFHTVDYNVLLAKLEYYRICGAANDWFKSYLSDRRQFVYTYGFGS